MIDRREAVRRICLLMGGAIAGAPALLAGTPLRGAAPTSFSAADRELLDAIGETILPASDVPGAAAIGIGSFMIRFVDDCYRPEEHAVFTAGLKAIEERCRAQFGAGFLAASPAQRTALCNLLDAEQQADWTARHNPDAVPLYFRMFKDLTVLGYFSSETGCTQVLRYIEVPGSYDGDRPYHPGDPVYY